MKASLLPARIKLRTTALLFALLGIQPLSAQEPPAGFGEPDVEIKIGVIPAKLKYDTEWFAVKPNSKVKLTLINADVMQHNLLICQKGEGIVKLVSDAALALGADAIEKQFVPDIPEVLFHTTMVDPGESNSIYFTAPEAEGDHPFVCTFPGHALIMNGIMTVSNTETSRKPKAKEDMLAEQHHENTPNPDNITVTDEPKVVRVILPDTSPDSLAVGLIGGFNYCFDTSTCAVRYGWRESFLNISPELDGRGGRTCHILGQRFNVGYLDFPLRFGSNDKPVVKFLGYRIKEIPEIVYSVDGTVVTQTVGSAPGTTPESCELIYTFSIPRAKDSVRFLSNPNESQITSPSGKSENGVLTIPAKDATKFMISVKPV